jgi:hypothetical protein
LYPELTEKLAVCNCPHPKIMLKSFKSNPSQLLKSWYMFMHQIPCVAGIGNTNLHYRYFFKQFVRGWMYNKQNFTDADLKEFVKAYRTKGALTGSINYYRAMLQTKPNRAMFSKIRLQHPL